MSLKPNERQELEEGLVEKLGRRGGCSLACRIIHGFRSETSPFVITDPKTRTRDVHFFLFDGSNALDMGGIYQIDDLLKIIDTHHEGFIAVATDWTRVDKHQHGQAMCGEERRILERRFRDHILRRKVDFGIVEDFRDT